jgi:pimeloyl-ACP methyl ester carboxylesterase
VTEKPQLILVHGLWMNRCIMWPLAWRLRRAGFRVRFFTYFSTFTAHERHAERLAAMLRATPGPVQLIGHSLGGVIILLALAQIETNVRSVLFLGSPLAGSEAGRQFMRGAFGRFCVGASGSLWQKFPVLQLPRGMCAGVIAGTRRFGLGRFFARLQGPNDGVVRVDETRLMGLDDHLVLPVSHTGMLLSSRAAHQAEHFLREGKFER